VRAGFDVMTALGHDYRRNSMLENELFLIVGFQDYRILIKGPNAAREFHATEQINGDLDSVLARSVEERVLNVLCRLIFHLPIFLLYRFHTPLKLSAQPCLQYQIFIVAVQWTAIKTSFIGASGYRVVGAPGLAPLL
jgi:hypothetical protein